MASYTEFLQQVGLTQAQIDAAAERMPKPMPRGADEHYRVSPSAIEGRGCFATQNTAGRIAALRHGEGWTEAGRYINHASEPNATAKLEGTDLIAYGTVAAGDEITLDYAQVRDSIMGNDHV
jgi:hypothetical protein